MLAACQSPNVFAGTEFPTPQPAPDIALDSVDGPVRLTDFKGKFTFIYFGYTFCPNVCPATMATLAQVRQGPGEAGDQVQVVMITVDPERDTPEQLVDYLGYFDDSFIGLSGDLQRIDQVGKPFGLYYQRHEGSPATGYLIDHTARPYLLDRDSDAILSYAQGTSPDTLLMDLQHLLEMR